MTFWAAARVRTMIHVSRVAALLLVLLLSAGGFAAQAGAQAPPGPAQCQDGLDNDGDALVDFPFDPDCTSTLDDLELAEPLPRDPDPPGTPGQDPPGPANPGPANPGPANPGPSDPGPPTPPNPGPPDPPPPPPAPRAACEDGADNDGDGRVDHPADPGCTSPSDDSETDPAPEVDPPAPPSPRPECANLRDDDGDGRTDHPDDPGCTSDDDEDETDPAPPAATPGTARPADPPAPPPAAPQTPAPDGPAVALAGLPGTVAMMSPFPVVRIRGRVTGRGTIVELLSVTGPARSRATVSCRGRRCPKGGARSRTVGVRRRTVHFSTFERRLTAGTVLEIRVAAPGRIGKYTRFTVRRRSAPLRADRCLDTDGRRPVACPES